jgi:DNA-binding NarL/FixJ family response regulator
MIKVLLADDFAVVRVSLCHLIQMTDDMQVVAMSSNGQEAVNGVVYHCPDVAVMDISMPVMDGIEATRQIRSKRPETRVLMVSSYHTPHYVQRSIEAGASGYVLKDDIRRDLLTAIRALHSGSLYFSTKIADVARLHIPGKIETNENAEMARALKGNIHLLALIAISFMDFLI